MQVHTVGDKQVSGIWDPSALSLSIYVFTMISQFLKAHTCVTVESGLKAVLPEVLAQRKA